MLIQARRVLSQPVFAASALFAFILTATGAFGTFAIVLPLRFGYWMLTTFSAAGVLVAASRLLTRYLDHPLIRSVATVALASLPTAVVAAAASSILIPVPMALGRIVAFFPAALVLNVSLLALWRLTKTRQVTVEIPGRDPLDDSVPPPIASKLPPRLSRSRLVAIEAQDHYLRVATREGDALVYMRFSDALAALEHSDGLRVHRSWWVARTSIQAMKFARGRGELMLPDGTLVPVSRKFTTRVKEVARRPKP